VRLGAHESIGGGLARAVERATAVGAETLQLFLKSSRRWAMPLLSVEQVAAFERARQASAIAPVVAHASYLANLAAPDDVTWHRTQTELVAQVQCAALLRLDGLVVHPGAAVSLSLDAALVRAAAGLQRVLAATAGITVPILLETMAGQGTQIGYRFEQLGEVLRQVAQDERVGICLDTAHVFAAGYDLRTLAGYEATLAAFEAHIGLARLRLVHLNDSAGGLGSRLDRHAHIGAGALGLDSFAHLLHDRRLTEMAGILETEPGSDLQGHRDDLTCLRRLAAG
jgi:deoxyribonuclease-4